MTRKKRLTKKPVKNNKNKTTRRKPKSQKTNGSNFIHIKTAKALQNKLATFKEGEYSNDYILACLYLALVINQWHENFTDFKDFCRRELPEFKYETILDRAKTAYLTVKYFGKEALGQYSSNAMRQLVSLNEKQIRELIDFMKEDVGGLEELTPNNFTANKILQAKKELFPEPASSEQEKSTDTALPNDPIDDASEEGTDEEDAGNVSHKTENSNSNQKRIDQFAAFNERFERFDGEVTFVSHLARCIRKALNSKQKETLFAKLRINKLN